MCHGSIVEFSNWNFHLVTEKTHERWKKNWEHKVKKTKTLTVWIDCEWMDFGHALDCLDYSILFFFSFSFCLAAKKIS